jgi:hypothetical protein
MGVETKTRFRLILSWVAVYPALSLFFIKCMYTNVRTIKHLGIYVYLPLRI